MIANGPLYLFSSSPICGWAAFTPLLLAIPYSLPLKFDSRMSLQAAPPGALSSRTELRTALIPGLLPAGALLRACERVKNTHHYRQIQEYSPGVENFLEIPL